MKRDYRHQLTRTISTKCTIKRFRQFYESLLTFCKAVKVLFVKKLGSNKVSFEIEVSY
jgi:hypothetical protein